MATWTDLTFAALSVLTATKMTQLDANLDALAECASGTPQWRNRLPTRNLSGAGSFVVATDCVIRWDVSGGSVALTLPAASTFTPGQLIVVKKTDSSANIGTITPTGADTLDGEATIQVTLQNETRRFIARTAGFDEI